MCSTPYCFGDCEECETEAKREADYEKDNAVCPNKTECNWVTIHAKQDKCTTCGETFNYP